MDRTTFTREDFSNTSQWLAFRKYINRCFVSAINPAFKEAVEEFAEDHITFYAIDVPEIENHLEELKDLAKEEEENPLREVRERLGYSRKEAAALVDVPIRTWEKWENGERTPAPYLEKLIIFYMENSKK